MSPAPSRTVSEGVPCLTDELSRPRTRLVSEQVLFLDEHPRAIGHIAKMSGGSQSHLLRCTDGFYVVKFQNNPQGTRTLVNELICANLAALLKLPVPVGKIIEVSQELIALHGISTEYPTGRTLCTSGSCFGSRHPGNRTLIFTRLPKDRMRDVENLNDFAGILLFDLWTSNLDAREILFIRKPDKWKMHANMIDNGRCFRGFRWNFGDIHRSVPQPNLHYFSWVTGIESFEPWLTRIEDFAENAVADAWEAVPPEWYGSDLASLRLMLKQLNARRKALRKAIGVFHRDQPLAFPLWKTVPKFSRLPCKRYRAANF
jgi:hypothetical protein